MADSHCNLPNEENKRVTFERIECGEHWFDIVLVYVEVRSPTTDQIVWDTVNATSIERIVTIVSVQNANPKPPFN